MIISEAFFINFLQKELITVGSKAICRDITNSVMTLNLVKNIIESFCTAFSSSNYIINMSHHLEEPFQEFLKFAEENPSRIKPSLALEIEPCLMPYEILEQLGKLFQGDIFFNIFDNPYPLIKSQFYATSLIINIDFKAQNLAVLEVHRNIHRAGSNYISLAHSSPSLLKNGKPFNWRDIIFILADAKESQSFYHYQNWNFEVYSYRKASLNT